ncbi:MAG: alpha/beta fold hydrolase [Planctomycetota bacterium]
MRLLLLIPSLAFVLIGCTGVPRSLSHPGGVAVQEDFVYAMPSGQPLRLDLHLPVDRSGAFPLVVWIHGGGWYAGSHKNVPIARLVQHGYAVAAVEYRRIELFRDRNPFPHQIHDLKAAIRFLRHHAGELRLDPERIAVFGHSAGGHLAVMLATTNDEPVYEGDVGMIGPSSTVHAAIVAQAPLDIKAVLADPEHGSWRIRFVTRQLIEHAPGSSAGARAVFASPLAQVSSDDAPFLLFHGRDDALIPSSQSELMHAELQRAQVASELHLMDGGHGDAAFGDEQLLQMSLAFLQEHI